MIPAIDVNYIAQNREWLLGVNEIVQKNVQDILAGKTNDATARCNVKKAIIAAGYRPGTAHIRTDSPEDLLNDERINLVLRTNVELAQGEGWWQQGQRQPILDIFPAQELFRLGSRPFPRDWLTRWRMAGEQAGDPIGTGWIITSDDRMIALKNHYIWQRIGSSKLFRDALDTAWPPFALNSGMWVRDVERDYVEHIGLIKPGHSIQPNKMLFPTPFFPIESERITEYLCNEPTPCDHCGEEKPFKLLDACEHLFS